MRPHCRARTPKPPGDFFGWQIFHVAQHQRSSLARGQPFESGSQPVALLAPKKRIFGRFQMSFRRLTQFHKRYPPSAAKEIECCIGGDSG